MPRPTLDDLLGRLQTGVASAAELMRTFDISQATISRLVSQAVRQNQVLRIGATRGARYALRREIGSAGSSWPVYRIDPDGGVHESGVLYALAANQFYLQATGTALAAVAGLSDGLPYFLQDPRPAGFLGRNVPRLHPELALPQRVADWTDEHYLVYLTQRGADTVSDLIVGTTAMDRHLKNMHHRTSIATEERSSAYPALAEETMAGGLPGSSAHGEHPKFATRVRMDDHYRHVLVKFSPPRDTRVGQRWSDLLVAEHHAHGLLESAGIRSCRSEVMEYGGRTFLEMTRFDRAGAAGRVGVTSLHAIDLWRYGRMDDWIAAGERLLADRLLDAESLRHMRFLATFGALIGNTDRHFGNIAFFDEYDGQFRLAPAYDMLPMLFAPEHEQIVPRRFDASPPTAQTLSVWPEAHALAQRYWRDLSVDTRVSDDFRAIAAGCASKLAAGQRQR